MTERHILIEWEEMEMEELLFTRKYNKEEYCFIITTMISWGDGKPKKYLSVETPANCFGYHDYVIFNNGNAYTLYRYLQPWILKKIKEAVIKAGYEEYIW